MSEDALPIIVALEPDLFWAARIEAACRVAGGQAICVSDCQALREAAVRRPALILIDLAAAAGCLETLHQIKAVPALRDVPVVAFGSHVDTAALQAARRAGCEHAWARSRFATELPALLARVLRPVATPSAGCMDSPPALLLQGIAEFNAGAYWTCHETLEMLWRQEPRPVRALYQGILQIGVGFLHLQRGNRAGALKVLRRGLARLEGMPEICQGVDVAGLRRTAQAVADRVAAMRADELAAFDLTTLPVVRLVPMTNTIPSV